MGPARKRDLQLRYTGRQMPGAQPLEALSTSRKTQVQPQQEGHDPNSEPWKEQCERRGQGSGPGRGCRGKGGPGDAAQMLHVLLSSGTSEVRRPLWALSSSVRR